MKKKIYASAILFCFIAFFASCVSDNENAVDEEWVAINEQQVKTVASDSKYKPMASKSGNGSIYWRSCPEFIPEIDTEGNKLPSVKITEHKTPYMTDSVLCRYEGWFYKKDGTKYIFDTTEINVNPKGAWVNTFIDGWITMLMSMREGEQVEVCIPQELAYGANGLYSGTTLIVPGYTTLWFRIKLLKIIPLNPGEFD